MRIPSQSIPWVGAESVPTRPVSPSPTPSRHGGSVSPTPSALPAQNPLLLYPSAVRRATVIPREAVRVSTITQFCSSTDTHLPPPSKQTLGSPPTETTSQYAPYSYSIQPPSPLHRTSPLFQKPSPFATSRSIAAPALLSPIPLSSPTFALRSGNAVAPS